MGKSGMTESGNDINLESVLKTAERVKSLLGEITASTKNLSGGLAGVFNQNGSFSNLADSVMQVANASKEAAGAQGTMNSAIGGLGGALANATLVVRFAMVVGQVTEAIRQMIPQEDMLEDKMLNAASSMNSFSMGMDTAKSKLGEFNTTLFATAEQQGNLRQNMQEVQNEITTICQNAANERRGYTSQEIDELNNYFSKLDELNAAQLGIEQNKSDAIAQQAISIAQTHSGSLAEYQTTAQEWIKTSEEQGKNMEALIQQQTTSKLVLLNQEFGDRAA